MPPSAKRFRKQSPDWSLFSAVEDEALSALPVPATHLSFRSAALGKAFGFENVWLKNDGLNPSASLKDRASFLVGGRGQPAQGAIHRHRLDR